MKKVLLLLSISFFFYGAAAQNIKPVDEDNVYEPAEVLDSVYGITMYEKLNPQLGGDSSRNNQKGYALQGWAKDYYKSGNLLHKGFYEDGQLKMYKNYYDNGQMERFFKIIDFKRTSMDVFYDNGNIKAKTVFFDGDVMKSKDYYPNGQLEYEVEHAANLEYLLYRRAYAEDGTPQDIFELVKKKKKLYHQKLYHPNGQLQTEGSLVFNMYKFDYLREGSWKVYDDKGKLLRTDQYVHGEKL